MCNKGQHGIGEQQNARQQRDYPGHRDLLGPATGTELTVAVSCTAFVTLLMAATPGGTLWGGLVAPGPEDTWWGATLRPRLSGTPVTSSRPGEDALTRGVILGGVKAPEANTHTTCQVFCPLGGCSSASVMS